MRVAGGEGIEGDTTALSADRSALFVWDPATASADPGRPRDRRDDDGRGPDRRVPMGTAHGVGQWLAPAAAAKSFLRGSVVVSPDGSRVYAIGVKEGVDGPESSGSTGVFVFDAATLEPLGIWQPTADFASLALSRDSRFGMQPACPASTPGRPPADQKASITVFDTSDGSIRLSPASSAAT